ncbi:MULTISPECIES: cytochrome P450 [Mycobacterium]|uniref:Cytochrome P450 n=2 Tax=Mycobacterium kiyosense TaxID=2871094 RepID=A0A9P3Q969_9MYCO|nr:MULTISPECIES: cytochrome P450 [Mycobacterium]BDE16454.1 cytochrome P450 [Mycobacterium sp. 20KCMC460]GLB83337.1 cytochrome P450 [Mycobacterium kiyosense]GLB89669.1 cytochrome P450 [Mycobacterium kiyosense]GLB96814.1 cytochrome P450 [Mycobacterium kiyosense]GLC00509.1 cytochrome P450 [Mycobacterium kiyosense]
MTTSQLVFDPFSAEYYANPYETYRRLRDEAPVYYSEQYDFYALSRHQDVAAAFKDFETYSSSKGVTLEEIQTGRHSHQQSIIWMDPPEHRRMRSLVNKVFTPRAITSQQAMVRDRIRYHLSRVNPEAFDVVEDFSALFPVEIITIMMGVPEDQRQNIRLWIDAALHREPGQVKMSRAGAEAMMQTGMLYYNLIQQRREKPGDDMITALINAEIQRDEGGTTRLDDVEIAGFATLLGGGGAETVTKLVGTAVVLFARHPQQWQQLLADRSKVPAAVEEVLRYEGPVQYDCRYTLKPVELHGVTIPAGKAVMLLGASANRDERAFTDADVFDINRNRSEAPNLGFGYGVHSCLGAALARMESVIAIEHLLDFMPDFALDEDGLRRVSMTSVAGYANVPVRVHR